MCLCGMRGQRTAPVSAPHEPTRTSHHARPRTTTHDHHTPRPASWPSRRWVRTRLCVWLCVWVGCVQGSRTKKRDRSACLPRCRPHLASVSSTQHNISNHHFSLLSSMLSSVPPRPSISPISSISRILAPHRTAPHRTAPPRTARSSVLTLLTPQLSPLPLPLPLPISLPVPRYVSACLPSHVT